MDSKQLDDLLQKYWNAETSLEEEQQLRAFFASLSDEALAKSEVPVFDKSSAGKPENLKETASLFRYFENQKKMGVNDSSFDNNLKSKLKKGKVISISVPQVARIAAGLLVVVAATFFIRQEIKKAYPEDEDTYNDPKVAFEETKKALMMISNSFNKGKKQASKINVFNEAAEKVQHNKEEKRKEKETNI